MKPISVDFREHILTDCDRGVKTSVVANTFSVSRAFVNKLKRQRAATGTIEPKPHGGGRQRALADREEEIRELMEDENTYTIAELHALLKVECTPKTVWMEVRRLGYTFKKRR